MSSDAPDWTIRIPGSEGQRLTEEQRVLLQTLEAGLPPSGSGSGDVSALVAQIVPILRALVESGLSAKQIADNSRLRPPFVKAILDGGA